MYGKIDWLIQMQNQGNHQIVGFPTTLRKNLPHPWPAGGLISAHDFLVASSSMSICFWIYCRKKQKIMQRENSGIWWYDSCKLSNFITDIFFGTI
jgi:hypothetical protein